MVRRRIPVLLRRSSILSSSHEVAVNETSAIHHRCQRLHQWRDFSVRCACIKTTSNSVSLINNQTLVFHRWYHSNSEQNIDVGIGIDNSKQMDDSTKQILPNEKRRVDPFAKRPSQKCDPYGLAGQSLSYDECLDWLRTLEDGWKLLMNGDADNNRRESVQNMHSEMKVTPIFLQRQFYHATFHDASQFLSQIALLSTNLNHYPYLSMERVLVDDLSTVSNSGNSNDDANATNTNTRLSKQQRKKSKGWVFVSTVRCSTYRPPVTRSDSEKQEDSPECKDKGLTYHDFHLAMNIDVETNREVCVALLL